MASPSSSSSSRPSHPPRSSLFTAIAELDKEEEEQQQVEIKQASTKSTAMPEAPDDAFPCKHQPTPLHHLKKTTTPINNSSSSSSSVLCNKCRPSSCDKTFVVPFDLKSPNTAPRAILNLLTRAKSPRPTSTTTTPSPAEDDQYWKLAAAELSRKLVHATRRRDEALLEASRLKKSVSDLERRLARLESDCLGLKSSLDSHQPPVLFPTDTFLSAVSSARSAARALARSSRTGSPLVQTEASINRLLYHDFEKWEEVEGGVRVLDPVARCGSSRAAYEAVRGITWEDVLTKGTKHYDEWLSRFCDRKMGGVVGALGWERRAWPEGLLQAFFAAAKGVWLVGLLARCVHPPVPVLRVEGGARFDAAYMEDVAPGERVGRLVPATVRTMVAPGFYVYSGEAGVLKCKVLCTYVQH